jgi:hypothetical protein
MDAKRIQEAEQEKIVALAKHAKHYCDLLIEQCDSWLSEEEGRKNVAKKRKREFLPKSVSKCLARRSS